LFAASGLVFLMRVEQAKKFGVTPRTITFDGTDGLGSNFRILLQSICIKYVACAVALTIELLFCTLA
jgi:hypothetical protein